MDLATIPAAILAGGRGTRLRPAIADRPKVLAPVNGRPFVAYLLDRLAGAGVREVLLLTGYLAEQVEAEFGDEYAGMHLRYSPEPEPLGTGGAIRHALPLMESPRLLVLNGDSYCDLDLRRFAEHHLQCEADVSVAMARATDTGRFGHIRINALGRVERFDEKTVATGPGWVNAGVYLLERNVLEAIPPGNVSLERECFPDWAVRHRLIGYRGRGELLDIGTPESYARAEAFLAAEPTGAAYCY